MTIQSKPQDRKSRAVQPQQAKPRPKLPADYDKLSLHEQIKVCNPLLTDAEIQKMLEESGF